MDRELYAVKQRAERLDARALPSKGIHLMGRVVNLFGIFAFTTAPWPEESPL